jgi:ClpP class serine protease
MASKKEELFGQMKDLWTKFEAEHVKTTKVSQKNARTFIGDLKKLVTEYRAASVEESK